MSDADKPVSRNFFVDYDDLSDSSDSDSDQTGPGKTGPESEPNPDPNRAAVKRPAEALPKPEELFNSVRKPAFLHNPLHKSIDWDTRVLKAPEEPPKQFKVWKSNAVPPPQSYETQVKKMAPPGMDMAIKWSNVYEDNGDDAPRAHTGPARFLPEEEQLHSDEDDDDDASNSQNSGKSAKKRRVETFQQKEKRKRDLGQATSDKNFVEEEKRILRQSLS